MTPLEMALALCELEDDELDEEEAKFVDIVTKKLERAVVLHAHTVHKLERLYHREIR